MAFESVLNSLRAAEREAVAQLEKIRTAIASFGGKSAGGKRRGRPPGSGKRRKMSAEARAKIAAAQKKRWAKQKATEK